MAPELAPRGPPRAPELARLVHYPGGPPDERARLVAVWPDDVVDLVARVGDPPGAESDLAKNTLLLTPWLRINA